MALLVERFKAIERGASAVFVSAWTAALRAVGPETVGLWKAALRIKAGVDRERENRPGMNKERRMRAFSVLFWMLLQEDGGRRCG